MFLQKNCIFIFRTFLELNQAKVCTRILAKCKDSILAGFNCLIVVSINLSGTSFNKVMYNFLLLESFFKSVKNHAVIFEFSANQANQFSLTTTSPDATIDQDLSLVESASGRAIPAIEIDRELNRDPSAFLEIIQLKSHCTLIEL